jgi:SAM-dependent methyltransferase
MSTPQLEPYDEFTYYNYSYPQTHVDRLATIATLFGMKPAPVENCRVLELGCGDGSNLLPMAFDLRESRFFGIDRAAKPIARGKEMIDALQLGNLELQQMDLMSLAKDFGKFDYIISHGLYSWVPSDVRDRIMEICQSCLEPQGVAYISYNVYPGCRLREITREMMLFHTRDTKDPQQKVALSRAVAEWAADVQTKPSPYSTHLLETKDYLTKADDAVIYHDLIAEVNQPVYFHQFIGHAVRHGLQFLSEAEHFNVREYEFGDKIAQQLRNLGEQSILTEEQYLDFLGGRSFRQTLLCRHDVEIDRKFPPERIREFYLVSRARPTSSTLDFRSNEPEEFRAEDTRARTNFPLAKAALFYLGEIYPQAIRYDELLSQALRMLGTDAPSDQLDFENLSRTLAEFIFRTYGVGLVGFHLHLPKFTVIPGERPLASPLARLQAKRGTITTTLLGNNVKLEDSLGRQFLLLLDGSRDHAALVRDFGAVIESSIQQGDIAASDKTMLLHDLPEQIEQKLADLGKKGFLLA